MLAPPWAAARPPFVVALHTPPARKLSCRAGPPGRRPRKAARATRRTRIWQHAHAKPARAPPCSTPRAQ
eukprot:9765522-Alexandrium_andersonii.AAC.1